jgi:hypothetical protein
MFQGGLLGLFPQKMGKRDPELQALRFPGSDSLLVLIGSLSRPLAEFLQSSEEMENQNDRETFDLWKEIVACLKRTEITWGR